MKKGFYAPALGALALLAITACGDDSSSSDSTAASTTAAAETTAAPTTAATETSATGEFAELCALAEEMYNQDNPPTAEQLTKYQALAPEEIKPAVDALATPLLAAGDSVIDFFKVIAKDDIQAQMDTVDAWEEANCGIPHSADDELPEGASEEIEADANRVDVVAKDFSFEIPTEIPAGRTSFVLTNHGAEAHFLAVVKLAEGVTMEQALAAEDPEGMIEGEWGTDLAFPDGEDEEAITFDLEPGHYGVACFIPTTDGTPHAMKGMTAEFTVA